ncbi:nuclear mitotic apparatus protein 1-like [Xyrichtys novacula]|uniref:Nuclear mitotic apparatus protein 1-like n=1 Tax=Xyrichtys novacula TaxID=13765 RepID=A0AAV1FZG9_XYRNO|nr:nuclear mitotic apparatus protein 1-like [Xyrichtys novacula]
MDPDTEVQSILRQEGENHAEEKEKWKRPPSSYGSMRSDSEDEEEEEEEEMMTERGYAEGNVNEAFPSACPVPPADLPSNEGPGFRLNRSDSPETLYTMTTMQSKPPGAVVIASRSSDIEADSDLEEDEDADELLVTNSPEPPEPVEFNETMQMDEHGQPGILHPEQDLPHIFKSIQDTVSALAKEELFKFKMWFYQWESNITLPHVMDGDILDFVDKIIEILGMDRSLFHTLTTLESIGKKEVAEELRIKCKRALFRAHLKQYLTRKYHVIREGVVRAGRQNLLNTVYVEPEMFTCGYGRMDPSHEQRPVTVNNLYRLQKADGTPARTVVTTGIPGIGMSVSVGKFCLDWAEMRANKDLQFIVKLSFRSLWILRNKNPPQEMSIKEMVEYYHPECKDFLYLEDESCKFAVIMDSFDCYQASLDWENARVINDNHTKAHPDTLIVNIIRGNVLPGAWVWILGRSAAVSQIPSNFIDVVTEIQGFSDENKDVYLRKRFNNRLAAQIVAHYKQLPTLRALAYQPFVCWMLATVFERCFQLQGYGEHPPRLTVFYTSIVIVQTNRKLQFYQGKAENELKWSSDDRNQLSNIGKMAFKMLERRTTEFSEEDVKECGLKLTEVTVFSGLCTELPTAASDGRRRFCFVHPTIQDFMAALYVFMMFRTESKNVLDSRASKIFASKDQTKSAVGLVQCALARTSNSTAGQYDMFLRFLCGILSPTCHDNQLSRYLFCHNTPKLRVDEVQRLLEQEIRTALGSDQDQDRAENLRECLRELTQEDE